MPGAQDERLDPRVAREAAQWLMRMHPAAEPDEAEQRACLAWRASHAQHELAWQRAQQFNDKFMVLPPELGKAALGRKTVRQRRQAVTKLALLLTMAPAGILAYQHMPVAAWRAAYRTATGERRSVQLADGSRVQMNTDTAFDVVVDDVQRLVLLHEGELLIETAPDRHGGSRPFRVRTGEGFIRAIGTRFNVRREAAWSEVAVFEGAVEVAVGEGKRIVAADEQLRFTAHGLAATEPLVPQRAAWVDGMLQADDQTLAAFAAELARHRRGWIRCDPAVAGLRISGSFQLDDTDQVLRAVAATLPVRIRFHTRYLATIVPA